MIVMLMNVVELSHRPLKENEKEETQTKFKFQTWFSFTRHVSPSFAINIIQLFNSEKFLWLAPPPF
jgi:hypothetical protein